MLPVSDILSYALDESGVPPMAGGGDGHRLRYGTGHAPVVVWNITNECNMACPHCYSAARLRGKSGEAKGLSLEDSLRIVERLREAGVRILIFSGGEPLLRPDWPELARAASEAGMGLYLSTNGVCIDPPVAGLLRELDFRYVGVSLDGMPDFNDSYRHFRGGYEAAFRGIVLAREAGIQTGLRMTLSGQNEGQLFSLLAEAKDRGVERFYVSHLVYGGRGIGYAQNDQEKESKQRQMYRLFFWALQNLEDASAPRIVTGGNDADGVALFLFVQENLGNAAAKRVWELLEKRGGNSAGEKIINIDHKGNLHPDQFWRSVSPGNLLDAPLSELMGKGVFAKLPRRTEFLKGRCGACPFQVLCRGSHRERAEVVFGDIWAEDPACYIGERQMQDFSRDFYRGFLKDFIKNSHEEAFESQSRVAEVPKASSQGSLRQTPVLQKKKKEAAA